MHTSRHVALGVTNPLPVSRDLVQCDNTQSLPRGEADRQLHSGTCNLELLSGPVRWRSISPHIRKVCLPATNKSQTSDSRFVNAAGNEQLLLTVVRSSMDDHPVNSACHCDVKVTCTSDRRKWMHFHDINTSPSRTSCELIRNS